MPKLRFVFVLSSFQLYGGVLLVIEYANQLVGRDHMVDLLTPRGTVDSALIDRLDPSIRVIESSVSLPTTRSPFALLRLLCCMARELPSADVVVATHTPTVAAVLLSPLLRVFQAGSSQATLSIQTMHNRFALKRPARVWLYMDYPEMFRGRQIEQGLLRLAPRWFDAIWAIAQPLKEVVSAQTNTPVIVTGSGLPMADLLFDRPLPDRPLLDRPSRSPIMGRRRILYVGNSLPRKGLREFLAAMQIICEQGIDSTIVIAGGAECQTVIDQSWIGESANDVPIEFHSRPSDEELCDLYASADLFVSASWGEGLGYPPLEAMACGTPVVLTDSGGVRDYAEDEQNCLMVPPKDVGAMAVAVERILGDEGLAARLSSRGIETAKRYDWKSVADRVEASAYELTRTIVTES